MWYLGRLLNTGAVLFRTCMDSWRFFFSYLCRTLWMSSWCSFPNFLFLGKRSHSWRSQFSFPNMILKIKLISLLKHMVVMISLTLEFVLQLVLGSHSLMESIETYFFSLNQLVHYLVSSFKLLYCWEFCLWPFSHGY